MVERISAFGATIIGKGNGRRLPQYHLNKKYPT
jgi:hypothetical protein